MKKIVFFATLASLATLSGVAFANNIHDGTNLASSHQTETAIVFIANTGGSTQVIMVHQPAIATNSGAYALVIASNADTPFQVAASKDVAANAISEVTYEPKFPNLVLSVILHEWTIIQYDATSEVQNTALLASCPAIA